MSDNTDYIVPHGILYWLRWIAVLPGALISGALATFPLHWILYATLSNFVQPYPELPERLLTGFIIAAVVVWSGSKIAPDNKDQAAAVLFAIWMAILLGSIVLALSGTTLMGRSIELQEGGVGPIMAALGALTGLYIVRKKQKDRLPVV